MRTEKEIRLRVALLEGQLTSIARLLQMALKDGSNESIEEYSTKLSLIRSGIQELYWVLDEIPKGNSVLDSSVTISTEVLTIRQVLERMKSGALKMSDLSMEHQALVRRGALELKSEPQN